MSGVMTARWLDSSLSWVKPQRALVSEVLEAGGGRSPEATSGLRTQRCPIHDVYECHDDQMQGNDNIRGHSPTLGPATLENIMNGVYERVNPITMFTETAVGPTHWSSKPGRTGFHLTLRF